MPVGWGPERAAEERERERDTDSMNNVRNVAPEIRTGAYELTIVI